MIIFDYDNAVVINVDCYGKWLQFSLRVLNVRELYDDLINVA